MSSSRGARPGRGAPAAVLGGMLPALLPAWAAAEPTGGLAGGLAGVPTWVLGLGALAALAGGLSSWRPAWVPRWPGAVLSAVLGVSAAAGAALVDPAGGLRLDLDASTEPLLPDGDPSEEVYRQSILDFGDDEIFLVALTCDEVFSIPCLRTLDRAVDRIARLDGVVSVRSLLDATSFRWVPAEQWVEVQPFIDEIPEDPGALAELRRRALADPVYRRSLVGDDARTAALDIRFRSLSDAEFLAAGLDDRIARVMAESVGPGQGYHLAGRPHVKVRVYRGMTRDLWTLLPLAVGVAGVALFFATGSLRAALLSLAVAGVSVLWTFAAIAASGRPLTILTGLLGPTLLALGSVYGVHVLARLEEEAEATPDRRRAAEAAIDHLGPPSAIAAATTAAGFGALWISDVPAVRELGSFAVLGIAAIHCLALTALPAAWRLVPGRASGRRRLDRRLDAGLGSLARAVDRHGTVILAGSALALAGALAAIPRVEIDTDYLSNFSPRDPIRRDFEEVNRRLAGAVPLYVVMHADEPGAFREPARLRALEATQARLEALPGVSRALSFVDGLKTLNRAFQEGDPAEERIPDTRAGVSELLFMMPKGELQRFATVDHAKSNLVVRTGEVGSGALRRLEDAVGRALEEGPLPEGVRVRVTGNALLLAHSADGIARSQPLSVSIAAFAALALVSLGLRSPALGLVALVPNLMPVLVYFGLLGLGLAPLSLPASLIGSAALGIAVDDTAHYLARYRSERRAGASPEEAVLRCGRRVGRAIAVTSVMLVAGFLVMLFSDFATLREFGWLTAITMALCLVSDLLLLPALLLRTRI